VQASFRGFVALNAMGALVRFGQEVRLHPLTAGEAMPAVMAVAAIGAVTFLGVGILFGRWSGGDGPERSYET
jgi:hypothetical protein